MIFVVFVVFVVLFVVSFLGGRVFRAALPALQRLSRATRCSGVRSPGSSVDVVALRSRPVSSGFPTAGIPMPADPEAPGHSGSPVPRSFQTHGAVCRLSVESVRLRRRGPPSSTGRRTRVYESAYAHETADAARRRRSERYKSARRRPRPHAPLRSAIRTREPSSRQGSERRPSDRLSRA